MQTIFSEGVSVEACDPGARKKIIKRVTDLATEPNLATKSKLEDKRENIYNTYL